MSILEAPTVLLPSFKVDALGYGDFIPEIYVVILVTKLQRESISPHD